jgi:outer membrane protein assembly factor BamB
MILDNMLISGNKIYVGGYLSMYCLNTDDGSEIWKYELPNGACAEPVLAGDKLIIGGCWDLWCLNALTGALLWRYEVPGPNPDGFGGVTVVGDKIYTSCSDGNIYCFTID